MGTSSPERRSISLGFTDEMFPEGLHICYLYNDERERLRVMSQFLGSGLAAGEKVMYLVDAMTPAEMLDSLEGLGVDARACEGALTVAEAESAYCPTGTFEAEPMLDTIRDYYTDAVFEQGYAGARVAGETGWCLVEGRLDLASMMVYESRVNSLLSDYPCTACCQYDTRCFSGEEIMGVLTVHPVMIVRGQLVRNPYYVAPEVYLRGRQDRMAG
ncbi:MAG: MEDS domain-containing protein [Armatimonadetes bacterium]|nr:MEDS domain-containing protein [Armatimonadota bacterium]